MAKKNKGKVIQMLSPESYIRQKARSLPLLECLINDDWEESGIASLTVARKHSNGNITAGMYLMDLKCLGVKDAMYWFNIYEHEYKDILKENRNSLEMIKIPYTLAHNIVYAGVEYAEQFGFRPHKDFNVAKYILEEDSEEIELMDIECGLNGKPAYVRGPLDNDAKEAKVIAQLEKAVGPGNYIFISGEDEPDEDEDMDEPDAFSSTTFQLKIQLNKVNNPPVWRRIKIPSDYTFYELHEVIQLVFGWTNSHLFMFSPGGFDTSPVITETHNDDDFEYDQSRRLEAEFVILSEIFKKEKQHYTYIYDFGDTWEHKITLEKIIQEESVFPDCIKGKGKCPPEDCGGVWGYESLRRIMEDSKHPEYKETAQWLGLKKTEKWDPTAYNLEETRQILAEQFGNDTL